MKTYSTIFALFLVVATFLSTRSWAQTYRTQPQHELQASREAHSLSQEIQRNQPVITEARQADNRSTDAMHWTFGSMNQLSPSSPAVSQQPLPDQKGALSRIRVSQPIDKPMTTMQKPTPGSL